MSIQNGLGMNEGKENQKQREDRDRNQHGDSEDSCFDKNLGSNGLRFNLEIGPEGEPMTPEANAEQAASSIMEKKLSNQKSRQTDFGNENDKK